MVVGVKTTCTVHDAFTATAPQFSLATTVESLDVIEVMCKAAVPQLVTVIVNVLD